MCEGEFKVFFGDQTFIEVGLSFGKDFGLILGHADSGQAFNEGVGVEGEGLSLHGAQDSGWGGGCKRAWRFPRESAPTCPPVQRTGRRRGLRGLCYCGLTGREPG